MVTLAFARLVESNTNTVTVTSLAPRSEGTNVLSMLLLEVAVATRLHEGGKVSTREQVHAKERPEAPWLAWSVS